MSYSKFFEIYNFDKAVDLAFKVAKIKTDKVIYGSNQWTYKYWVIGENYHYFGNFRVYWAYRWSVAEKLDAKGFVSGSVDPRDATEKDIIHPNYAKSYYGFKSVE